jgi:hypothetical protein
LHPHPDRVVVLIVAKYKLTKKGDLWKHLHQVKDLRDVSSKVEIIEEERQQIAIWLHNGVPKKNIPARPWIAKALRDTKNHPLFAALLARAFKKVLRTGDIKSSETEMRDLARLVRRVAIRSLLSPEWAPNTLEYLRAKVARQTERGQTDFLGKPLYDTGLLVNSHRATVYYGRRKKVVG